MPRNKKAQIIVNTIDPIKSEYDFHSINTNLVTLTLASCRYFEKHKQAEVSIKFGTDAEIATLNNEFRGKDNTTNILSFPSNHSGSHFWDHYIGDQILSIKVIEKEAIEQNKPFINHYSHMIIHSTLHLLGYDHENDNDAEIMESLEIKILNILNIPSPY